MNKLKIVFFGTPQFVVPILESLHKNFEVVGVVTASDKAVGRKQIMTPSAVAEAGEKLKIAVFKTEKLDEDINSKLSTLNSDLFVVAAFGKIIPEEILNISKFGSINVHPSLLPKYRGPSPVQSTILNGDRTTGITIIKMDSQMDHGPIVYQTDAGVRADDTFASLVEDLFEKSALILEKVIPDFVGGKIELKQQDHEAATFCKIIKKEDGYFVLPADGAEFDKEKLDRMIRAYYPWPNAWTKWNGKIVKFLPSTRHSEFISESSSSKILKQVQDDNKGWLIQMEGKKPVKMEDFLRGHPDFPINEF